MTIEEQLILHEGLRLKPYTDTVGKLTIGVGRNLTDVGITRDEAMFLLEADIDRALTGLQRTFPWFDELSSIRKRVLIDMCFNLGLEGLKAFLATLSAIEHGDYTAASYHMLHSKWARQVGDRAKRLALMMLKNVEPTTKDIT